MRCCGGSTSTDSPSSELRKFQPVRMWRSRLRDLNCVSTSTRRSPLLMQLERVKSMMRYSPPNGTAGFARSRVSGSKRVPFPPARMTVTTPRMTTLASQTTKDRVQRAEGRRQKRVSRRLTQIDADQTKAELIEFGLPHEWRALE